MSRHRRWWTIWLLLLAPLCDYAVGDQLQLLPSRPEHVKYAGHSLFVSCKALEAVGLSWFGPDGEHITGRKGTVRVEPSPDYGDGMTGIDLVLNPISRRERGQYTCRANINGEQQQADFSLVVFKPIAFRPDQSVQFAAEGGDFLVRCDVTGDPEPQTAWRGVRRRLNLGPGEKFDVDPESGGLVIRDVRREDEGQYRCKASQVSSKGSAVDTFDVQLKVQYKPEWFGVMPVEMYAFQSGSVNLTCQAMSEPPAEFLWYKNDDILLGGPDYDLINTNNMSILRLRVISAAVFGEYTCRAQNQIGAVDRTILLKQAEKPDIPEVLVSVTGGSRLKLKILHPDGETNPPVDGFKAQYKREVDSWQTAASIEFRTNQPYVINNLQTDTVYQIRVAARNLAGYGDFSAGIRQKTALHVRRDTSGSVEAHLLRPVLCAGLLAAILVL